MALDPARTWFRYHQMFADLLRLELRRTAPGEVKGLHRAASAWLAGHGYLLEAIRHAQAAGDWELAAGLLAGHWPGLHLDGRDATVHELLAGFPPAVREASAQLAPVAVADELAYGSLDTAERYLDLAERGTASVPGARPGQAQLLVGIVRLLVVRQRGDLAAVAEEARRLEALAEVSGGAPPDLGQDLRALALINLGIAEFFTARFDRAGRHLERAQALAHLIGRPHLKFTSLAYQASNEFFRSFKRAAEHSAKAVELASGTAGRTS